jgi:wyosine [tRNA(Phe)-imidazoG37] synthetase (radical SAM superfamily)
MNMAGDYNHINLEELIEIYRKEACELREALLSGASWDELKEKSANVTQLSIAIHSKNPRFFKNCNPAEFPLDRSSGFEP